MNEDKFFSGIDRVDPTAAERDERKRQALGVQSNIIQHMDITQQVQETGDEQKINLSQARREQICDLEPQIKAALEEVKRRGGQNPAADIQRFWEEVIQSKHFYRGTNDKEYDADPLRRLWSDLPAAATAAATAHSEAAATAKRPVRVLYNLDAIDE